MNDINVSLLEKFVVNAFSPAAYIICNIPLENKDRISYREVVDFHNRLYYNILVNKLSKGSTPLTKETLINYPTICGFLSRGIANSRIFLEELL